MREKERTERIIAELEKGMGLSKCRKCGCMKGTLENLRSTISATDNRELMVLYEEVCSGLKQMETVEYNCLGCEYCYPAVAMNIFLQAFPEVSTGISLTCGLEVRSGKWPPVAGEYYAFCHGEGCPVAVSTLASPELSERLAEIRPKELCIVGKTETENIGIEKIIKNTITNPTIRVLILAGNDARGHYSGKTLLALHQNGVDMEMRVIGSPGKQPVLKNLRREEVDAFRSQISLVDMIGCTDIDEIVQKIRESASITRASCGCNECSGPVSLSVKNPPVIEAETVERIKLDRAGYFVIIPDVERGEILVEHYDYDNRFLRTIKGKDAKSIYMTIIKHGWVTELSHAAYLGRELTKAELSIKMGFRYLQDGI